MFLYSSLFHLLSNVYFCVSDDECDDLNQHVKQPNDLATSTVTSTSYVIRDKDATRIPKEKFVNATSIVKGKVEDATSITKNFHASHVANLTKIQHKPLIIELN